MESSAVGASLVACNVVPLLLPGSQILLEYIQVSTRTDRHRQHGIPHVLLHSRT